MHTYTNVTNVYLFIHQLRLSRIVLLNVAANFSTSNKNTLLYLNTLYQLQLLKSVA
jgi:hypothetical protein